MKTKFLANIILAAVMIFPSIGMCEENHTVNSPALGSVVSIDETEKNIVLGNEEQEIVQESTLEKTVVQVLEEKSDESIEEGVPEIPVLQRVQLSELDLDIKSLSGNIPDNNTVVELLKKKAVILVIEHLKISKFDYTSDFSDLIADYDKYISAVNVFEKNSVVDGMMGAEVLYIKADIRAAALNDIIKSRCIPKKIEVSEVVEATQPVNNVTDKIVKDTSSVIPEQERINRLTEKTGAEQEVNNERTMQGAESEMEAQSSNDKNVISPSGRESTSMEENEQRHKWAMGYDA